MDARAAAIQRERTRLEQRRRLRATRDALRRGSALTEGDRIQRRPMLGRLHGALLHRHEQVRRAEQEQRSLAALEECWSRVRLEAGAADLWRGAGLLPQQAALLDRVATRLGAPTPRTLQDLDAVIEAAAGAAPLAAVESLVDLHTAGVLTLSPAVEQRMSALAADLPPPALTGPTAFVRWATAHAIRDGVRDLPSAALSSLTAVLLDELIERRAVPPPERIPTSLQIYCRARTDPAALSDEDLVEVGWADERWRRRLVQGQSTDGLATTPRADAVRRLVEGDVGDAALELLVAVGDAAQAATATALLHATGETSLPEVLRTDRTVWPLLRARLGPVVVDVVRRRPREPFSQWAALVTLRDAVHAGDVELGLRVSSPLMERIGRDAAAVEVHTGRAYLYALKGDGRRALGQAKHAAAKAKSQATTDNVAVLQSKRDAGQLSPYIALGLAPGDDGWSTAYASLYRRHWRSSERAVALNWARTVFTGQHPTWTWFTYPIRTAPYVVAGSGLLRPPSTPMPRFTEPLDEGHLQDLRAVASAETIEKEWDV